MRIFIFSIYVFRYSSNQLEQLNFFAEKLVGNTEYKRPAWREEAPLKTDCLTAIHYIFKKALSVDIPITFIGDMPRKLISMEKWNALKIKISEAKCGDLIFVRNKKNAKLLSHVALIIDINKIFHCSPLFNSAIIQSSDEFFSSYEQLLDFRNMIRYVDPRNKNLRKKVEGKFIII